VSGVLLANKRLRYEVVTTVLIAPISLPPQNNSQCPPTASTHNSRQWSVSARIYALLHCMRI